MRRYTTTTRGQIHWIEEGQGDAVVLLHQIPASGAIFANVIALLAQRYRVIAPDLPGFGNSDALPEGFEISDVAAMLREVLEQADVRQAKMFGIHTGAAVAAELARQWPDLVESVVFAGFPYVTGEEREVRARWIDDQTNGRPGGLPIMQPAADGAHVHKRWFAGFSRVCWAQGRMPELEVSAAELDFMHEFLITALLSWQTTPHAFAAAFSYDADGMLPWVNVPVLVLTVTGAHEGPHAKRAEALARLLPDARTATLDADDAYFPYWHAEEVRALLEEFWLATAALTASQRKGS